VEVTIKSKDDEDHKKLTKTAVIFLALGSCALVVLVIAVIVHIARKLHKKSRQREDYVEV